MRPRLATTSSNDCARWPQSTKPSSTCGAKASCWRPKWTRRISPSSPWRRCSSAASSSTAPATRFCVFCRLTFWSTSMWTQRSRPSTISSPNMEHTPPRTPQEDNTLASRAAIEHREISFPVQKDPDILAAAARLAGGDMCSVGDLSSAEVRAILKLGHEVKRNPREYRHALDAKQMVLMFEKASLRTRLSFEAGMNTMGGNAIFVDQTSSPLGEREAIADVARNVEG